MDRLSIATIFIMPSAAKRPMRRDIVDFLQSALPPRPNARTAARTRCARVSLRALSSTSAWLNGFSGVPLKWMTKLGRTLLVCRDDGHARGAVPAFVFDFVIDFESNLAHHGEDFFIFEFFSSKRFRIGGIEVKTQRDAERDAVLRHHQILGLIDRVMGHQLFDAADDDFTNLFGLETDLGSQCSAALRSARAR